MENNKAKEFLIKYVSRFIEQYEVSEHLKRELSNDFDGFLLNMWHNTDFRKNIVKRSENIEKGTIEVVHKINGKYVLASYLNRATPIEYYFVKPKRKKITVVEYLPIN